MIQQLELEAVIFWVFRHTRQGPRTTASNQSILRAANLKTHWVLVHVCMCWSECRCLSATIEPLNSVVSPLVAPLEEGSCAWMFELRGAGDWWETIWVRAALLEVNCVIEVCAAVGVVRELAVTSCLSCLEVRLEVFASSNVLLWSVFGFALF